MNTESRSGPVGAAVGRPYHHGDLRRAMVANAMDLARQGGPEAVVLRAVARRAGVSATAAYRHFASHDELVAAVKQQVLAEMGVAMQTELDGVRSSRDPAVLASRRLAALGHAYLRFAWQEPQLYRTAFAAGHPAGGSKDAAPMVAPAAPLPHGKPFEVATAPHPHVLLAGVLDELAAANALTARRSGLDYIVWAAVHGLALLTIEGPLRDASGQNREQLADAAIEMILRGI